MSTHVKASLGLAPTRTPMATLYTAASVLLFPSQGFGLPVLEAQMCGTPVVCSDRVTLPEVAHVSVYYFHANM